MRLRNITGAKEYIANSSLVVQDYKEQKGKWQSLFPHNAPVHIEIGMGKGQFIMQMAALYPDINFVGIEMYSSVLYRAVQKLEETPLPNLKFICMNAIEIEEVFDFQEVAKIYLNFSDPWPKDRHAKRRLPSRQFLERFEKILAPSGTLEFKTDNRPLFDFALEELEPAGWELLAVSYDLHHDEKLNQNNVMTEYEEKFSSQGNPIFKYIIRPKKQQTKA